MGRDLEAVGVSIIVKEPLFRKEEWPLKGNRDLDLQE
jgi:hypothetical protein